MWCSMRADSETVHEITERMDELARGDNRFTLDRRVSSPSEYQSPLLEGRAQKILLLCRGSERVYSLDDGLI